MLVNLSEGLTNFSVIAGLARKETPTKLRPEDIAHMVKAILEGVSGLLPRNKPQGTV